MARNIELKARLACFSEAIQRARDLNTAPGTVERQRDTYFTVPRGRLKLRRRWVSRGGELEDLREPPPAATLDRELPPELIQYQRADESRARKSDYVRIPLAPGTRMGEVLALAMGIDVEVDKVRVVFLHEGVRIHVDAVQGLGTFLELEALVTATCNEAMAARKVDGLSRHFDLRRQDLQRSSYRELVLAPASSRARLDR